MIYILIINLFLTFGCLFYHNHVLIHWIKIFNNYILDVILVISDKNFNQELRRHTDAFIKHCAGAVFQPYGIWSFSNISIFRNFCMVFCHWVKSIQIRSYFWNTDQKWLRIWTLFTQCASLVVINNIRDSWFY